MFAALCSPDLATAAERLARFKPLIGPITIDVRDHADGLELTYRWKDAPVTQPAYMHGLEAMFVTKLARLGTRQRITPTAVVVTELPRDPLPFEDYLGIRMKRGEVIRVTFDEADAHRPICSEQCVHGLQRPLAYGSSPSAVVYVPRRACAERRCVHDPALFLPAPVPLTARPLLAWKPRRPPTKPLRQTHSRGPAARLSEFVHETA